VLIGTSVFLASFKLTKKEEISYKATWNDGSKLKLTMRDGRDTPCPKNGTNSVSGISLAKTNK